MRKSHIQEYRELYFGLPLFAVSKILLFACSLTFVSSYGGLSSHRFFAFKHSTSSRDRPEMTAISSIDPAYLTHSFHSFFQIPGMVCR